MACNCGCGGASPCTGFGFSQNEVNTPNCTSQLGVNQSVCGQSAGQLCSCNNCGCQQNVGACVPTPYYLSTPGCQESHDRILVNQQWVTSIKTSSAFSVPACPAGQVIVVFPALQQIMIGSYLYTELAGEILYLKVVAFDPVSHAVTLLNDVCRDNAIAPGTNLPACTQFLVVDPPNSVPSSNNYLNSPFVDCPGFNAPPANPTVGYCIQIPVTNVIGLVAGKTVSIMGGTYTIQSINGANTITICNNGLGLAPGTPVECKDGSGNYVTPVNLVDTSPCTNPVVDQGAILVCKNGIQQPLDASAVGQIPVVVDATTNEVKFQSLDVDSLDFLTCTPRLAGCTQITSGVIAANYTFDVDNDPAIFHVNDIIQVISLAGHTYLFEVTAAPVSNTAAVVAELKSIDGVLGATPTETICFAEGHQICLAPCCDQLQEQIDDINVTITDIQGDITNIEGDITNIVNVEIPCAPKADFIGGFDGTTTVDLDATNSPPWYSCGTTVLPSPATSYTDVPIAPSGVFTYTLPANAPCTPANPLTYEVNIHGQVLSVMEAAGGLPVFDPGGFTAIANFVDLYLSSTDTTSDPLDITESAHVAWVTEFANIPEVTVTGYSGGDIDINSQPTKFLDGANVWPSLATGQPSDLPLWHANVLPTVAQIDYHAASFHIKRICKAGETIAVNCRYRGLQDYNTVLVPTSNADLYLKIRIYGTVTMIRVI